MKILVLHRYFWPQPYPYASMLKDISESFNLKHDVTVLTTLSHAKNEVDLRKQWSSDTGIQLKTLKLDIEKQSGIPRKLLNSLYWGFWVMYKLITTRADIVMVATTPPVIMATIVRWASKIKGFRYIYHCQDIHPEAMQLSGNLNNKFFYNVLRSMDKKTMENAWRIITLSTDMKNTIRRRGLDTNNVEIINNFIFEEAPNTDKTTKNQSNKKTQFLFAGSLGRLQNLEMLMEALICLKDEGQEDSIEFIFMGDGSAKDNMVRIKDDNDLDNVTFLGHRSTSDAVDAMQNADFGIVSISEGICSVAYPSKTMMYLGNGLAVFALVNKNTELHNFITNNNLGYSTDANTPQDIANSIKEACELIGTADLNRSRIRKIANEHFSKEVILNKFSKLM